MPRSRRASMPVIPEMRSAESVESPFFLASTSETCAWDRRASRASQAALLPSPLSHSARREPGCSVFMGRRFTTGKPREQAKVCSQIMVD